MQDSRKKCDKPWFLCDSRNQDLRVFDIQQQSFWRLYNYFVKKMLLIRPWSMVGVIVVTLLQIVVILEKHFSNISLVLWIPILERGLTPARVCTWVWTTVKGLQHIVEVRVWGEGQSCAGTGLGRPRKSHSENILFKNTTLPEKKMPDFDNLIVEFL